MRKRSVSKLCPKVRASQRRFRKACKLRARGVSMKEIAEKVGVGDRTLRVWKHLPGWPQTFQVVGTRPVRSHFMSRDRETAVWMMKGLGLTVEEIAWVFNKTERVIYLWMREFPNPRPPEEE